MAARYDTPGKMQGFTLVELLVTMVIASLVMVALGRVVGETLYLYATSIARQELTREASFAMARLTAAVRGAEYLFIPLDENPATAWSESVREVLAITPDPAVDRDQDTWDDANTDKDFLDFNNNGTRDPGEPERVDEDVFQDMTNDGASGIKGIDDDGDGLVDEGTIDADGVYADDDEDGIHNEDYMDGLDNDLDGTIDEDCSADMNKDGDGGVKGVDDDGDGLIDEGPPNDDDEDGSNNDDWFDPVVFFLSGTTLMERTPVTWDENGDATIDGLDFVENPVADNVSAFRVERLVKGARRKTLVDITLTLDSGGDSITLHTLTRVGGAL